MASVMPELIPAAQLQLFLLLLSIYQVSYPVLQWGVGGLLLAEREESKDVSLENLVAAEAAERSQPPAPRFARKVRELLGAVLVPPVIAVFIGFIVGIIPGLRLLLVDTKDFDCDSPLEFLFNAVVLFGQAAVPMNMMVLGASLASIPNFGSIQWPVTLAVTACKLVLHPAIGFAVVYGLDSTGFIAAVTGNRRPSFIVVACLMCATPTANNVQVMAEVSGGPECKRALSAMIFVMYCLAPFVLTFWIVVAISMAQSA
jgi:predicted permease